MSFENFIIKSKKTIEALKDGDIHTLIKEESQDIKQEKNLKEQLSSINYVNEFNQYLKQLDKHYVGKLLSFNYNKATILTNDDFVLQNNGIPQSSFLIATLKDFNRMQGIEHFIVLFVSDFTNLEDHKDNQNLLLNHHKSLKLQDTQIHNNAELNRLKIEENKLSNLIYSGLSCKVVGMFFRKDNTEEFEFSSQINLVLSPPNYYIAKPDKNIKNIIANHKTINESFVKDKDFKSFKIGKLRETETDVFIDAQDNPDIYIDLNTFRAKRTAFLSKTRLGKSNNAKIILSQFILDNSRKTNTNLNNKTGIIVFDENGEYSNTNNQDKTSIYEKYKHTNYVKRYSINQQTKLNLMLNFYVNPVETMQLFNYLLQKESGSKSIYIESFLSTDLLSLHKLEKLYERENKKVTLSYIDKFKFQLFWTILYKAGYFYGKDNNNFFDIIGKYVEKPFVLVDNIINDIKKAAIDVEDIGVNEILETNKYQKGDDFELEFSKMVNLIDLFIEIYIHNPEFLLEKNKKKYVLFEPLMEMLNTTNKAGYKLLRKFHEFHSYLSNNKIDNLVNDVCDTAIVAIIDMSSATNSEVKQYYAQRITENIFNHCVKYFNDNISHEKPYVLGYYEEAHNLFPSDSQGQNNKGGRNIYYKLAKEGAKYNFGMIYVTQSPSNISSELLVQTENFFIGHMSAPKEIAALNNISYYFDHLGHDIMSVKKVGLMRMLTDNHRYPIPVQIEKFE